MSETDKARLALLAAYYKALPAGLVEKIVALAGALKRTACRPVKNQ